MIHMCLLLRKRLKFKNFIVDLGKLRNKVAINVCIDLIQYYTNKINL